MVTSLSTTVYRAILGAMDERLGSFIRRRREELGLTQQQLADLVGAQRPYLSHVENGGTKWPQHLIPGLAKVLRVTQAELAERAGLIQLEEEDRHEYDAEDPLLNIVMLGAKKLSPRGRQIILKIMEDIENEYRAEK